MSGSNLRSAVRRAVSKYPDKTYKEIAEMLSCSASTVAKHTQGRNKNAKTVPVADRPVGLSADIGEVFDVVKFSESDMNAEGKNHHISEETLNAYRHKQKTDRESDELSRILNSDAPNKYGRFGYPQQSPMAGNTCNNETQVDDTVRYIREQVDDTVRYIRELEVELDTLKKAIQTDQQFTAAALWFGCSLWEMDNIAEEGGYEHITRVRGFASDAANQAAEVLGLTNVDYDEIINSAKTRWDEIDERLARISTLLGMNETRYDMAGNRCLDHALTRICLEHLWWEVHRADLLYTRNKELDDVITALEQNDYTTLFELRQRHEVWFKQYQPTARIFVESGNDEIYLEGVVTTPYRTQTTTIRTVSLSTQVRLSAVLLWLNEHKDKDVINEHDLPSWARPAFPSLAILRLIASSNDEPENSDECLVS